MLAETPAVLVSVRDILTALAAITASALVLAKAPGLRRMTSWLWRRNVAEPAAAGLSRVVGEVVEGRFDQIDKRLESIEWQAKGADDVLAEVRHEVRTNNGSSLRDVADRSEKGLADLSHQVGQLRQVVVAIADATGIEVPDEVRVEPGG